MSDWTLFDCNAMLGRHIENQGVTLDDVDDFKRHMRRYGIDKSLVFGAMAKGNSTRLGNERLLSMIRGEDSLLPVLVGLPNHTGEFLDAQEFGAQLRDCRAAGVRLCPKEHDYELKPWCVDELMSLLDSMHMPTFIDLEIQHWSDPVPWDDIATLCERYPNAPIIPVRIGCGDNRNLFALMKRYPNLYLEISYYATHLGLEAVAERFGAQRMLFGTDAPIHAPACPIGMLYYSGLSDGEKEMIFSGNMERLIADIRYGG